MWPLAISKRYLVLILKNVSGSARMMHVASLLFAGNLSAEVINAT